MSKVTLSIKETETLHFRTLQRLAVQRSLGHGAKDIAQQGVVGKKIPFTAKQVLKMNEAKLEKVLKEHLTRPNEYTREIITVKTGFIGEMLVCSLLKSKNIAYEYDDTTLETTGLPYDIIIKDKNFDVKTYVADSRKKLAMVNKALLVKIIDKKLPVDGFIFVKVLTPIKAENQSVEINGVVSKPYPLSNVCFWDKWDIHSPKHSPAVAKLWDSLKLWD